MPDTPKARKGSWTFILLLVFNRQGLKASLSLSVPEGGNKYTGGVIMIDYNIIGVLL